MLRPQVNPTASGDTLTYDAVNGWDETRGDTGYKFHFPTGTYVSLAYWATPLVQRLTCTAPLTQLTQDDTEVEKVSA